MSKLVVVALALLTAGCAVTHTGGPKNPPPLAVEKSFSEQTNVVFTPPGWPKELKADIYKPEGAGPFPAVLVVHGGAWVTGSQLEMKHICDELAGHGFVAINIEYRLAPAYNFPAPLQDLQQAMHWIHAHAAEYRIDDHRIGAWGYSAGAELVSLLATLSPGDPNFAKGTRVRAVVSGGTPADLRFAGDIGVVRTYIGQKIEDQPELYRQASPIAFVSADDPPMFLYHGTWDFIFDDINARRMKHALDRVQVPAEIYLVHWAGHIRTFTYGGATDAGVAFLQRHLR
jgi:acetyl esterase/lipase